VIELITPVAMEKGLRFAIREGGHTVGAGTIAEICYVGFSVGTGLRPVRPVRDRPHIGLE